MTPCAHAVTPCVDILWAYTESTQVCSVNQPPSTWGDWRSSPQRQQMQAPPFLPGGRQEVPHVPQRVHPPGATAAPPVPRVVYPPPMKKQRVEHFAPSDLKTWEAWALEAEQKVEKVKEKEAWARTCEKEDATMTVKPMQAGKLKEKEG